ncbi:transposase [Sorangium sp. So ce136]|uniref:IS66 family transposase n=1 Tax=Sorangium sp. So ce136 TaxID=3133284 RepID=UPI003F03AEA7
MLVQAKDKCRRGHFWVLVADRDHVLFRFTPHHNQDGPKAFLRGYKGYVQADASNVYDLLFRTEQVTEVGCWARCRRHFFEAITCDRERATAAIGFIHQLYAIDKATKELPPSRRTEQRRKAAKPVLQAFRGWVKAQDLLVLPKTPIAVAVGYALSQWPALTRFLEDGRLRLDNNRTTHLVQFRVCRRHGTIFGPACLGDRRDRQVGVGLAARSARRTATLGRDRCSGCRRCRRSLSDAALGLRRGAKLPCRAPSQACPGRALTPPCVQCRRFRRERQGATPIPIVGRLRLF